MRSVIYCILIVPFILSSCSLQQSDAKAEAVPGTLLIHLTESTNIIRTLIAQNKIGELLEEHNPEQLALLLNNKSPAQMAFEAEVLSSTIPLVAVYYFSNNEKRDNLIEILEELSAKYDNQVKFVAIDIESLFSLRQDADIDQAPTIVVIKNREIINRIEGVFTYSQLERILLRYIYN